MGEKFGKSSAICQTKLLLSINNLMVNLFIHQTSLPEAFIHPLLSNIIAAKLSAIWYQNLRFREHLMYFKEVDKCMYH